MGCVCCSAIIGSSLTGCYSVLSASMLGMGSVGQGGIRRVLARFTIRKLDGFRLLYYLLLFLRMRALSLVRFYLQCVVDLIPTEFFQELYAIFVECHSTSTL